MDIQDAPPSASQASSQNENIISFSKICGDIPNVGMKKSQ